jgi:hypothetical protein
LLLLNPSGNPPPASPLLSSAPIRNKVQLRVKGNEKATGLCDLNGRNKMLPATHRIELPICDWLSSLLSIDSLSVCVYNVLSNEHTLHTERAVTSFWCIAKAQGPTDRSIFASPVGSFHVERRV